MIGAIREYFLLSDARATAKLVPEDARAALDRQLTLGRQRAEAADALWSNGHVAEGLRLAADAFDATIAAVGRFSEVVPLPDRAPRAQPAREDASAEALGATEAGDEGEAKPDSEAGAEATEAEPADAQATSSDEARPSEAASTEVAGAPSEREPGAAEPSPVEPSATLAAEPSAPAPPRSLDEPEWAVVLRRRGLPERKMREVVEAARARAAKTMPLLDAEVSAADGELFQQLVTARRHVERVLAPASMTPAQIRWTRVSRIGFASVLALAGAVGLWLLLRPPTGVEATASAQYNAEFPPSNVIDGNEDTEWLLPNAQAGWLDVRIMPPERIETLRLKNSHNRHFNDRATREYTIEFFSNGQRVHTIEGSWAGINPRPPWTEHQVGIDNVERIRFNVRSWHRAGAGLAEIEWE
ncbi:MAG TPA: discoidin domain-containing protein [Sandaracinaceae bacterium]